MIETTAIGDRDDWLELRKNAINASEVAIVLGLGAYGSRAELYAEKKNLRPPRADNQLLRRGRWMEASVFEALADEYPTWKIRRAKIYMRDTERYLGATPDGFALRGGSRGVVQAKVISRAAFRRRWLQDAGADIQHGLATEPIYYKLQVLTEMMLAECDWGVLAVLVASEYDAILRVFEIERDPGLEDMIVNGVAKFKRDHLDTNTMPDFEPQADAELIHALYPQAAGTTIDLAGNNQVGELVDRWQALTTEAGLIKKKQQAARSALEAMLGDNTYGILPDGRCLQWKNEPRKGYKVEPSAPRILRLLSSPPAIAQDEDDE